MKKLVPLMVLVTLLFLAPSARARTSDPNVSGKWSVHGELSFSHSSGHPDKNWHAVWVFRDNLPGTADGCNKTFAVRLFADTGRYCMQRSFHTYTGTLSTDDYFFCPVDHESMPTTITISILVSYDTDGHADHFKGEQKAHAVAAHGCSATTLWYDLNARPK
ncbi:MAG TPA: hypothetical protein VNN79_25085 [Actinomycetota bacterium]|nr:hypothetical protein [Actinomycetota bacterium]